jgi:aspartyl-tRNA(Asn)/glutamyl-tRNA(Gln) amidotransferase subunit A
MARTVADTTLLYQAMGGASVGAIPALNVLRLGVPDGYLTELLDEDIRRAFETSLARLSNAGCTIARVELPHASATPDVYLLISLAEAAEYHAPSVASVPDLYTAPVRQRIELGRYILAEDYLRARRAAVMLRAEVDRALAGHDALVLPTLPIPAPPLGASSMMVSGASQPVRAMMLRQTQLFNVTGHPAITLPNGASRDGLPAALQLVGARAGTARLLAVAAACEPHLASGPGSVGGGTAAGSETGGASASRTADSGGWRSEGS